MITAASILSKNHPQSHHRSNIHKLAMGSKGEIGLDLDWVKPTELGVNGLVIMPTKTDVLRCKPSVTVA